MLAGVSERRAYSRDAAVVGDVLAEEYLPPTRLLIDDFNDDSLAGTWFNWGGGNVVESSGRLNITTATPAFSYFGVDRVPTVDIHEAYVSARLLDAGNQSLTSYGAYPMALQFSTDHSAYWIIVAGQADCYTNVNNVFTLRATMAYSPGTHVFFAVGETGGQLQWMWSTDGTSWTVAAAIANPFSGDTVVAPFLMVGTDAANGSTTTMQVDDLYWTAFTTSPASVSLTPATGTWTAEAVTAEPQPVTVSLIPAAVAWTAQPVAATPGPVAVSLTPASAGWSAVAVTAIPQPVVVALTPASSAWSAVAVAAVPQPVTVVLIPATSTWTAIAVTTASGPVEVALEPAAATWTAQPVDPVPGAVTVALTPAAATWNAVQVTPAAVSGTTPRPNTGVTARPSTGTTLRPAGGTTARPGSGTTVRPYAGTTARP